MFESTLVDERSESHRPWTVAVSFLGQSLLVLVAVLIPLLTTEALPTAEWMAVLLAPPPPLGSPPPAPRAPQAAAAVAPQQFDTDAFVAPAAIPEKVALLVEDATGPPRIEGPSISNIGTVPGGVPGGAPGGVLGSPPSVIPKPPPPPEVKPAKKATSQAVRVSTLVQSAKLIRKVAPVYPHLAKEAGISGVVNMEAIIGHDGTVRKLQVMSGHPLLIQAAKDAVSQWRYRPTILNDEPVEVLTRIEVKFVLR